MGVSILRTVVNYDFSLALNIDSRVALDVHGSPKISQFTTVRSIPPGVATLKTGNKTSKMGILFASKSLIRDRSENVPKPDPCFDHLREEIQISKGGVNLIERKWSEYGTILEHLQLIHFLPDRLLRSSVVADSRCTSRLKLIALYKSNTKSCFLASILCKI